MNNVEFAIREVAVAIDHLLRVVDHNVKGYDNIPDSLHHALLSLMKEIELVNWEAIDR